MIVTISLTEEEWQELFRVTLEDSWEESPEELLIALVRDLTGCPGGGRDEQEFARAWLVCRYGPPEIVHEERERRKPRRAGGTREPRTPGSGDYPCRN